MAVLAPMPSASVSTATAVKPGFFSNWRKANLRSFMVRCQCRSFVVHCFSFLRPPQSGNPVARLPGLDSQEQRPVEVFGRRGKLFHEVLVSADFAELDNVKASILDQVDVVVHRVALSSQEKSSHTGLLPCHSMKRRWAPVPQPASRSRSAGRGRRSDMV